MPHRSIQVEINPAIPSASVDYATRIPPETAHFIKINSGYNFTNDNPSLEEKRHKYLLDCQAICPSGQFRVQRRDGVINTGGQTIPTRYYQAPTLDLDAQIVFLHGGGFVVGNLESHDEICAHLCAKSGLSVTAVDYRLAPEYPFPAAFEDCLNAYLHLAAQSTVPMILCGDSAGGNLAAAISVHCRDHGLPMPKAQILLYPYLGADPSGGSYQHHRDAPMLNLADMTYFGQCYLGENSAVLNDQRALPLRSWTFAALPPTYCQIAEIDPIADDGLLYCQMLKRAGVPCHCETFTGLPHSYLRYWQHSTRVQGAWKKLFHALYLLTKDLEWTDNQHDISAQEQQTRTT